MQFKKIFSPDDIFIKHVIQKQFTGMKINKQIHKQKPFTLSNFSYNNS